MIGRTFIAAAAIVSMSSAAPVRHHRATHQAHKAAPAKPATAAVPKERARNRVKILLAEDNAVNMQLAAIILGKLGFTADMAGNGIEAVDAALRQRYDVILMDVQMPEKDGVEATREIRARGQPDAQPYIIAVTANVMIEDRQRYSDAGMNAFLAKPYTAQELTAALDAALESLRGRRAPAAVAAVEQKSVAALLDTARAEEVLDQLNEGMAGAFDDWIVRLDAELAKFAVLIAIATAESNAVSESNAASSPGSVSNDTNKKIQFAAHSIKGMCLVMGAQTLADKFGEVERDAKANTFVNADSRIVEIRELGTQSIHALKTLSAKHQAAAN